MIGVLIGVGIGAAVFWLWSRGGFARVVAIVALVGVAMLAGAEVNQATRPQQSGADVAAECSNMSKDADAFTRALCGR